MTMETENDQSQRTSYKEMLVYLEFDNQFKDELLDDEIFLRISGIEDKSPLLQINNNLYRGVYKSCMGNNLFLSECERGPSKNIFEFGSSIKLKHLVTQSKVMELTTVGIPSDPALLPQPSYDIVINPSYNMKSLLKKFANGTLSLQEDFIIKPREDDNPGGTGKIEEQNQKKQIEMKKKTESMPKKDDAAQNKMIEKKSLIKKPHLSARKDNGPKIVNVVTHKYERLLKLSLRPTRREKKPEFVAECDEYREAHSYNSLKCSIMKSSDYFRTISEDFNPKTLVGAVDIYRSVCQNIIATSNDFHRVLSQEEKLNLLSIKNWENLSMTARYLVIKNHLELMESTLPTLSENEKKQKNIHHRTIEETIEIYKKCLKIIGGLVKQDYTYDDSI